MAAVAPLYFDPDWYKGALGPYTDADTGKMLLAEIYNQLKGLNDSGGSVIIVTNMKQITAVTAGQTYTNAALINATIFNVFYDGVRLNGTTLPAYTFDDSTGEITFTIEITDGLELAIEYTTNP